MILAADVGGTNIRAAVVDHHGNIARKLRSHISLGDRDISAAVLIDRLSALFDEMIRKDGSISAIGIGFPGFFIGNSGVLVSSPNLPQLHNINLAGKLSEALNMPVHIQNDALCAAIGEHRFGAGKGRPDLLHITVGTGIGGGLILNNTPYTGEGGMAMEFGHLRVVYDKTARPCGCKGEGCVEAYASATAVSERYFEVSGIRADAREIYERACNGDQQATEIITSAGHYLGMAIAQSIKLLDIRTVTISGGVTGAWSLLHPAITSSLDAELIPPLQGKISVLKSSLNDNAGVLGAATLAG
ncbi:MAG: ROK family protein [Mariprofundaceae bacterium]|nr:ROK family protein [Mariprofundaceae bacterium]